MRPILITSLVLFICSPLFAQYSPIEPEELDYKNYTREEIRTYLLMVEPEESTAYDLARRSKVSRNFSYVLYGLSAVSLTASLLSHRNLNQIPSNETIRRAIAEGTAEFGLWSGIAQLGLGIWSSHRARKQLDQALQKHR